MIRIRLLLLIISLLYLFPLYAAGTISQRATAVGGDYGMSLPTADSVAAISGRPVPLFKRPFFLSARYSGGKVLHTDEMISGSNSIPYAQDWHLKGGFSSLGNSWEDIKWGMPYYGLGFGIYEFNRSDMGTPLSLYLFQGATLARFSGRLSLNYEWNLGTSFNWNVFDERTNPRNECVGAKANVYIAANIYLSWMMSDKFDIKLGATLNHVSNGATKMPNSGINTVGGFLELSYNFNRERIRRSYDPSLEAPEYESHFISDFMLHGTLRERKVNPHRYNLSSKYVDHKFFVMGFSYALMYQSGHKFRYGAGADLIYDESSGFTPSETAGPDGKKVVEVRYGSIHERFTLGFSARGEFVQMGYTIFALAGYNVIHGNKGDLRFYQAIGVKIPFWNNMYGSFAIRSKRFSKAQYLLFGIGYGLNHGKKKN